MLSMLFKILYIVRHSVVNGCRRKQLKESGGTVLANNTARSNIDRAAINTDVKRKENH